MSVKICIPVLESGKTSVCVGDEGGLCRGFLSLWWCLKYAFMPQLLLTKMIPYC